MAVLIADIRAGIAANLTSSLTGFNGQISAYILGNPVAPCIYVFPDEVDYDQAMQRGLDFEKFTVQAMVSEVSDEGGQLALDLLLASKGTTSVKAAIESDRTLGGKVDDVRVVKCSGYQVYTFPAHLKAYSASQLIGAQWTVEVYVTP